MYKISNDVKSLRETTVKRVRITDSYSSKVYNKVIIKGGWCRMRVDLGTILNASESLPDA